MMRRRWLIMSGAPWGATAGGQRYEQLTKALLLRGESVSFHCPWDRYPPSPYEPKTDEFDVWVVGFPFRNLHTYPFKAKIKIYDVCDYWEEGMVEGQSFRDECAEVIRWANAFVVVSPFLAAHIHMQRKGAPVFIIPNGLRVDANFTLPPKTAQPTVAFWGSWYVGQEWWDYKAVAELARYLSDKGIRFVIRGAGDRPFPATLPSYVDIQHAWWGIPMQDVIASLTRPLVGLVPFKSGMYVSLAADPVKVYEYVALQGIVLITNNVSHVHHQRVIAGLGDTSKLLCTLIDEAIERAKNVGKPVYVPTFLDRALEYIRAVEVIERWLS